MCAYNDEWSGAVSEPTADSSNTIAQSRDAPDQVGPSPQIFSDETMQVVCSQIIQSEEDLQSTVQDAESDDSMEGGRIEVKQVFQEQSPLRPRQRHEEAHATSSASSSWQPVPSEVPEQQQPESPIIRPASPTTTSLPQTQSRVWPSWYMEVTSEILAQSIQIANSWFQSTNDRVTTTQWNQIIMRGIINRAAAETVFKAGWMSAERRQTFLFDLVHLHSPPPMWTIEVYTEQVKNFHRHYTRMPHPYMQDELLVHDPQLVPPINGDNINYDWFDGVTRATEYLDPPSLQPVVVSDMTDEYTATHSQIHDSLPSQISELEQNWQNENRQCQLYRKRLTAADKACENAMRKGLSTESIQKKIEEHDRWEGLIAMSITELQDLESRLQELRRRQQHLNRLQAFDRSYSQQLQLIRPVTDPRSFAPP